MERTAEPAAIVRGLVATLERLQAVSRDLPSAQLQTSPASGEWSPNEILWHIRATADVYGEHITRILNDDIPRWRHVSPRARMKKSRYDQLPFAESITAFEVQRKALIAQLDGLASEAWQRIALVRLDYRPGDDWRLTLHERVWGMAHHEQIHCAQMESLAAAL